MQSDAGQPAVMLGAGHNPGDNYKEGLSDDQ